VGMAGGKLEPIQWVSEWVSKWIESNNKSKSVWVCKSK
jgi:hypothetical protein